MWPENGASYQNIGKQSSVTCGFDRDTRTPQLEYSNTQYVLHVCQAIRRVKPVYLADTLFSGHLLLSEQ